MSVKALANSIRNGRSDISIKTAEALVEISNNLNSLGTQVTSLSSAASGSVSPVSNVPPGNVSAITVSSATVDQGSGIATIVLSVTPPSPIGTFIGCHLYVEIPDQSSGTTFAVGVTGLGASQVNGPWAPIDLSRQTYVAGQPWTVQCFVPPGLDITQAISCRVDAVSFSNAVENTLVQANQSGASPSQTFTLVPSNLAGTTPSSGTGITSAQPGPIVASALSPDNSTGKLMTPVLVDLSTVPGGKWVGRLVLVVGNADPTQPANQRVVSGILTQAGPVSHPPDGVSTPHSFLLTTPTVVTSAAVWLQSGLLLATGSYQWNNIVPGITPSFGITYGSTTGVNDASAVILSTINAAMAVTNGLFGVAAGGITNSFLGNAAVATINVQNLAITNPLLASLAVQAANLASGSVTSTAIAAAAVGTAAIQNAAITNALIANLAVSGAQIQNATITGANIANATIAGANIALATITDANIATLSAGKITAGTISAAISVTAGTFTGSTLTLNLSGVTTTISNGSPGGHGHGTALGLVVKNNSTNSYCSVDDKGFTTVNVFGIGNTIAYLGDDGTGSGTLIVGNLTISAPVSAYTISIAGTQVLTVQQTGPGNPSFSVLGDAQTWCSNLLTALRAHGLVT